MPKPDDRTSDLDVRVERQGILRPHGETDREPLLGQRRNPRIAVTCKFDTGTAYPLAKDIPNTYWIKFLDSTFTEAQGNEARTDHKRFADATDAPTVAQVIDGENGTYLALGTVVSVFRDNGRWWIERFDGIRRFELKQALTATVGANATAYYLDDDGAQNGSVQFEVYDELGIWRGRAEGTYSPPHDKGSQGYARLMADSGNWEIIQMQPNALMILGQATADVSTLDANFTIDGVVVLSPSGAIITHADPAGSQTIVNLFNWGLDDDANVIAMWDENGDRWLPLMGDCLA